MSKEPWFISLDSELDEIYLQRDKIADAVFNVREHRIADALALAAASYSYSRAYDLSFFSALSGAISLFWSRLRGGDGE